MVTRAKPSGAPSVAPVSGHAALLLLQPPPEWELTDERFVELCELNPGLRFEIDERGRLSITDRAGLRSSSRALRIGGQVDAWALAGGGGSVTGAGGFYHLDEHALRAPDAAWVSAERAALMESDDEGIPHLCPDFVVEIRSPSDRLSDQQTRLELWLEHGVRLGWLIDPFGGAAYIYRPGQPLEALTRPDTLSGESVLPGLVVDLTSVWPKA